MDRASASIGFIGAGTLGSGLALALVRQQYRVCAVMSRNPESARALVRRIPGCQALESAQAVADAADLVFITTPDAAIGPVAASIAWQPGHSVVHCCGAMGIGVLEAATTRGAAAGAFHPCQTFAGLTDPVQTAARLKGAAFAIDAPEPLRNFLQDIARQLGGNPVHIGSADRPRYHAAAVLGCGYISVLLQAAASLWQELGFTEAEAVNALVPLSRATLENIAQGGVAATATGPAIRGDAGTLEIHLQALLQSQPNLAGLYLALAQASLPLAEQAGLSREKRKSVTELLKRYQSIIAERSGRAEI